MNIRRAALLIVLFSTACGPTITKHVRVQRHVDRKPSEAFQHPLPNAKVLSRFGERGGSFHTGVDLQKSRKGGETVLSARAGRVMSVGWIKGYGNQIRLDHADGYQTRYAHLKTVKVKLGQKVAAHEPVGTVGATGRASTPHLHFEIITPDGYFIDPLLLLP